MTNKILEELMNDAESRNSDKIEEVALESGAGTLGEWSAAQ